MNWLIGLFSQDSVAHSLLILSLVIACGLVLGKLSLAGIRFGIAGVLFSGLLFGHLQLSINHEVMLFVRDFGLVLFVYAIGLQVGPSFVGALCQSGLKINLLAGCVVLLGTLLTLVFSKVFELPLSVASGLFAGATTNTPALAAAQQLLASLPDSTPDSLKLPGLAYAVAYPFGIIGIIISMLLAKRLFKINLQTEAEAYKQNSLNKTPVWIDLIIENPLLNQCSLSEIPAINAAQVVVTRILHQGQINLASPHSLLYTGDMIRVVGDQQQLETLKQLIGPEAPIILHQQNSDLSAQRLLVTRKQAIGLSIAELCDQFDITISRLHRPDVEFTPPKNLRVQFGDELVVVGHPAGLKNIEQLLGNSQQALNYPQILPIFIGLSLGIILGNLPITIPGMPADLKLGIAGGPLVMAIILSQFGQWRTLSWHLPESSNIILKEVGIVLFLACVGLHSGDHFLQTLLDGDGWKWMGCAAIITVAPLLITALIGRWYLKLNFLTLCGLLAGSMTDPPALAFANNLNPSSAVAVAYATVYPLVMLLRILAAQVIVLI